MVLSGGLSLAGALLGASARNDQAPTSTAPDASAKTVLLRIVLASRVLAVVIWRNYTGLDSAHNVSA